MPRGSPDAASSERSATLRATLPSGRQNATVSLQRLMDYVHSTVKYRQVGWVGDDIEPLNLGLYADANYATGGGKSTSGVQLHVE